MTYRSHFGPEHPLGDPEQAIPFLDQDKWWVDASLEPVKLKDMEADHLKNTIHLLFECAGSIALNVALSPQADPEGLESDEWPISQATLRGRSVVDEPAMRSWLSEVPLVRAMVSRYRKTLAKRGPRRVLFPADGRAR